MFRRKRARPEDTTWAYVSGYISEQYLYCSARFYPVQKILFLYTWADASTGGGFTPVRLRLVCARGCVPYMYAARDSYGKFLDRILATLRAGSATPGALYSMMADAQAHVYEQKMTSLGQSLAHWKQRAQLFFDESPDDQWAYDALCISMFLRISVVDAAVLHRSQFLGYLPATSQC